MKRRAILSACLLISAAHAAAEDGSRSCRKWAEERSLAEGSKEMNRIPALIGQSWFLGYLAGRQSRNRQNFLGGTDNESVFLWLDKYCRDHPQAELKGAGAALEQALTAQKIPPTGRQP